MRLDVVTPRGSLVSTEADEVTAPGILGEFGVLPGHVPFLTGVRAGVLRWKRGAEQGVVAVGPGFAEVSNDRIVVLSDVGARADQIDVATAQREVDEAQRALDHWESEDAGARVEVEARRAWAQARLEAAAAKLDTATH